MNKKQRKEIILNAIERIETGDSLYACNALRRVAPSSNLIKQFTLIFSPKPNLYFSWTFHDDPIGLESLEDLKSYRLTALWLFYHMQ